MKNERVRIDIVSRTRNDLLRSEWLESSLSEVEVCFWERVEEVENKAGERRPDLVLVGIRCLDSVFHNDLSTEKAHFFRRTKRLVALLASLEPNEKKTSRELGFRGIFQILGEEELSFLSRALLRCTRPGTFERRFHMGPLAIDEGAQRIFVEGIPQKMPTVEFNLISCLSERPNHIWNEIEIKRLMVGSMKEVKGECS